MRSTKANILRKALLYSATGALACGLGALISCTQSVGASATKNVGTSGGSITLSYKVTWDPPGSYLADFDASQALLNLSLSNATISSTSGDATVTVTDASTGATLGQQSFAWTVNGNSIYAQDPTAVQDWLQQFTGYSDVDVNVQVLPTLQATAYGSASVTGNSEYV